MTGRNNLESWLDRADDRDRSDGRTAYRVYQQMIALIADRYGQPFERVLSAFVALSPNSDYFGNLRSLISVLDGVRNKVPLERVTVATYNHCRDRAWRYLLGTELFLASARGLKVRSFFLNIFDPDDPGPVTIDGHIALAWRADDAGTVKQSKVSPRDYAQISATIRRIARDRGLIANQVQATIWLARKRVLRIRFDQQLDLFSHPIAVRPDEIAPFPLRAATEGING